MKDDEMVERTYIDDIVDALFEGKNHRKYVLQEVQRRTIEEMDRLAKKVISKKSSKDKDWWKNELITKGEDKNDIVWFGGLNNKTISNMVGSATIAICRKICSENYDAIMNLINDLPPNFPKPMLTFNIDDKKVDLNEAESFLFIFTLMSMSKALGGGIWSEIGKQAADKFIKIVFEKLDISDSKLKDPHYELTETDKKGEIDARIIHHNRSVLNIEIKILGAGNPEIAREAIALEPDVFIVDEISDKMLKIAEEKGIKVIHFKDVLSELLKMLKEKNVK